jgi:hypothetical protein
MSTTTEQEIERLHMKLASINRLPGKPTAAEQIAIDGLWARIERLETTQVATQIKENKAHDALVAAREKEGME